MTLITFKLFYSGFLPGVVKKYPTHSGKHVVTGAMTIFGDVVLCAGYDEERGSSYINGMVDIIYNPLYHHLLLNYTYFNPCFLVVIIVNFLLNFYGHLGTILV